MAENKTKANIESVDAFIQKVEPMSRRDDCIALVKLMSEVTKKPAMMWGSSIVGFDSYHYRYESGREGDMCIIGFSPRKNALTIYLKGGLDEFQSELDTLGKFAQGKGCLYIKSLSDVNMSALKKMLKKSVQMAKEK